MVRSRSGAGRRCGRRQDTKMILRRAQPDAQHAALVHKSGDGCGAAAVAAFQAVRCDTGMPSRAIRLSTEQATRVSVFWLGRVRARRPQPMMVLYQRGAWIGRLVLGSCVA